jgi:hypothetical protein
MTKELLKENRIHYHAQSFEKYDLSQPVFKKHPELFDKLRKKNNGSFDYELIQFNGINYKPFPNMPKYRTCKYKDSYLLIDGYLNANICFHLMSKYGTENLYIRINPYEVLSTPPPMLLEEEFIQTPNPHWIESMKIYPGEHHYCVRVL